MSLLQFHIVLISAAILLALGLGAWAYEAYRASPNFLMGMTAIGSLILGFVLAVYLAWFITKKLPRFKK